MGPSEQQIIIFPLGSAAPISCKSFLVDHVSNNHEIACGLPAGKLGVWDIVSMRMAEKGSLVNWPPDL